MFNFKFNLKKFSSKVINPNSMIFQHKKELDSIQKKLTKMNLPNESNKISVLSEEDDFEPGINYFFSGLPYSIKVCNNQSDKVYASPYEGWVLLTIPMDKEPRLQHKLSLLNTGRIRYGKLLEIFDYLTALSCCRFNAFKPKNKTVTLVTVSVDSILLYKDINMTKPLVLSAYPTYTGNSSLEIRIDIYNDENGDDFIGSAFFVYALRSAEDYNVKMKTKQIIFDKFSNDDEKKKALLRYEIGKETQSNRIKNHKLEVKPPNQEESELLHKLFLTCKSLNDENKSFKSIKNTKRELFLLMQSQDMNINGHIFGGYIMRMALQLGYVCGLMYTSSHLRVLCVDSVNFYKPVIVGSVAEFVAEVQFVHKELLYISVSVYDHINNNKVLTTTINVTYQSELAAEEVYPDTYECGLKYLLANRRISKLFDNI